MLEFIKDLFKKESRKTKKSTAELIASVVSYVLLGIVVIILIITMITRLSGNVPSVFGYAIGSISSDSMAGVYDVGDIVFVKKVDFSAINEGDDILFVNPNKNEYNRGIRYIVHRVRSVIESDGKIAGFVTYGTNTPGDDTEPAVDVLGVVTGKSVFLGKLFDIKNLIFIVFLLIILYVAFALSMKAYRIITNKESSVNAESNINYNEMKEELKREIQKELEKESIEKSKNENNDSK